MFYLSSVVRTELASRREISRLREEGKVAEAETLRRRNEENAKLAGPLIPIVGRIKSLEKALSDERTNPAGKDTISKEIERLEKEAEEILSKLKR